MKDRQRKNTGIKLLRQELNGANKDLHFVNKTLHDLRVANEELSEDTEPTLNRYY